MLLTDKEICALSELTVEDEYPPTLDHHRNIARLQLKKVVEWLDKRHRLYNNNEQCEIDMPTSEWLALLKEVE